MGLIYKYTEKALVGQVLLIIIIRKKNTLEQTQVFSNKKPDYIIEKLCIKDNFILHTFAEVKSLINYNFSKSLEKLSESIIYADYTGYFSVYAIVMEGTNFEIYVYYNYATLLDGYDISHYKGFVPLNYIIPYTNF